LDKYITKEISCCLREEIIFAAMGKIYINDIRCYGYHGCLEEETKIGTHYKIDISVDTDLAKSAASDALEDTIDYVSLTHIALDCMKVPCKLIEKVLYKIQDQIFEKHPEVEKVAITIAKLNPPINANVHSVAVAIEEVRKNWEAKGND